MSQLGVRRKIIFFFIAEESLNVAADMAENVKKPAGHWRNKEEGMEESKRKNKLHTSVKK
jgi:hypothetical protein